MEREGGAVVVRRQIVVMLCTCTNQFKNHGGRGGVVVAGTGSMPEGGMNVELASRELCAKIKEGEAKLEEGSIEEAETSLREALSLNNEVRRFVLFCFFLSCCVCAGWRRGIPSSSSSSSCTEKKTNKNLILKKPDPGGDGGRCRKLVHCWDAWSIREETSKVLCKCSKESS